MSIQTQPGSSRSMLQSAYSHEVNLADHVLLTQPMGGGVLQSFTWSETMDQARRFATYLKSFDFAPGSSIAVLSKNTAHYFMVELGIWMAGHKTVTIFPTESAATLRYILEHSESRLLVIGKLDDWTTQQVAMPANLPVIELPLGPGTAHLQWNDMLRNTPALQGNADRSPDELSMIIYTSGSTGEPKGVMHNFKTTARAAELILNWRIEQMGDVPLRYFSHLPYAHVMERLSVFCASVYGGHSHIFYTESLATFVEDIKRAKPTLFATVPRLWMKFQLGVFSKMPAEQLGAMLDNPQMGPVVGKQVLAGMGLDEAVYGASGAAPLPKEVLEWYGKLGLPMYEAYGMTENFAIASIGSKTHHSVGCVGLPYKGVEVKISDEGEVLVRSPGQMVGYYKQPELTASCLTEDGYFRTGDLGQITETGELKITGRIKELFKTSKGKYIAPAPIEALINSCPLIETSAVSGANFETPYAAVILAEHLRTKLTDEQSRAELMAQLSQLRNQANEQLAAYQQLKFLVVITDPWTVENACLTPTLKLKRANIEKRLNDCAEAWYMNGAAVIIH
ncbi:MAG: AMP-binding protein [Limnobacter sp.]|nr:AMP-binding protein [Limnobacter sp.]